MSLLQFSIYRHVTIVTFQVSVLFFPVQINNFSWQAKHWQDISFPEYLRASIIARVCVTSTKLFVFILLLYMSGWLFYYFGCSLLLYSISLLEFLSFNKNGSINLRLFSGKCTLSSLKKCKKCKLSGNKGTNKVVVVVVNNQGEDMFHIVLVLSFLHQ